jgi:hypothetical protein
MKTTDKNKNLESGCTWKANLENQISNLVQAADLRSAEHPTVRICKDNPQVNKPAANLTT